MILGVWCDGWFADRVVSLLGWVRVRFQWVWSAVDGVGLFDVDG